MRELISVQMLLSVNAGQLHSCLTALSLVPPRWVKQQCEFAKQAQNPDEGPKLDLGFKDGQTIKINIAVSPTLTRLWESRVYNVAHGL